MLAAAVVPVLSGCSLAGSLVIDADDLVTVDVFVWSRVAPETDPTNPSEAGPDVACLPVRANIPELTAEALSDPSDRELRGCHVSGTLPLSALSRTVPLDRVGDRYVFNIPANAVTAQEGGLLTPPVGRPTAFSITFPGAIDGHDGRSGVDGSTVTWPDLGDPAAPQQWAVAVRPSPRPEIPLVLLGGLGVGAVGTALAVRRRARRAGPASDAEGAT